MTDDASSASDTVGELIGPRAANPIEVELFVRSLAPFGTRSSLERLIERLESLRATGGIESLEVRVWGDAVRTEDAAAITGDDATTTTEDDDGIVARITELFAYAADAPCSIGRYFRVATDGSLVDEESCRRLIPPRRCLSVRRAGDLVAVFPCDVGPTNLTPWDAVDYLETDRVERQVASAGD